MLITIGVFCQYNHAAGNDFHPVCWIKQIEYIDAWFWPNCSIIPLFLHWRSLTPSALCLWKSHKIKHLVEVAYTTNWLLAVLTPNALQIYLCARGVYAFVCDNSQPDLLRHRDRTVTTWQMNGVRVAGTCSVAWVLSVLMCIAGLIKGRIKNIAAVYSNSMHNKCMSSVFDRHGISKSMYPATHLICL